MEIRRDSTANVKVNLPGGKPARPCARNCSPRRLPLHRKEPASIGNTVGILVHGDNHFIVRGPAPDWETALALVRHWSLIRIGANTPAALRSWRISTKEFREDLE